MRSIIPLIVFFLSIYGSPKLAAQNVKIRNLQIGETLPDIEIRNLVNYNKPVLKLSAIKERLVVLDFWATWCSPCIAAFGKIDSLQKKFHNQVLFLPVSSQDRNTVTMFLDKMSKVKGMKFPSIYGDTLMRQYFKHYGIPHYVWLDDQKVVAITGTEELTEQNIANILNGERSNMTVKLDKLRNFDKEKPLFIVSTSIVEEERKDTLLATEEDTPFRSIITRYRESMIGTGLARKNRITLVNQTIQNLYMMALGNGNRGNNNSFFNFLSGSRVVWEYWSPHIYTLTNDSVTSIQRGSLSEIREWNRVNTFCYELLLPDSLGERKYEFMHEDLNRYFRAMYGIEGNLEKRKVKCLALKRTSSNDKIATRGGKENKKFNAYSFSIQNLPINTFTKTLTYSYLQGSKLPLIDDTGYQGNVDIEITCNLGNVGLINRELERYDLQIIETEKELDMIVIKQVR